VKTIESFLKELEARRFPISAAPTSPSTLHPADFNKRSDIGDLVELWSRARNIPKGDAINEIRNCLGIQDFTPQQQPRGFGYRESSRDYVEFSS
jgi:hypothetical protein